MDQGAKNTGKYLFNRRNKGNIIVKEKGIMYYSVSISPD